MGAGRIAFLGTPGVVRDADRFSLDELLDVLGANSGNLIFQHAAQLLIGGQHLHIGRSETAVPISRLCADAAPLCFPRPIICARMQIGQVLIHILSAAGCP